MMRSIVRRAARSKISQDLMSQVRSRAAKRKSIGATTSGMMVITKDVARQRACSE